MKKYYLALILSIWLASIAGFIFTCIEQDYVRMVFSVMWFVFVSIIIGQILISIYTIDVDRPRRIARKTIERIRSLEIMENKLEAKNDKLTLIIKEKENHFWYRDYKTSKKMSDESYERLVSERDSLEDQIKELKESKMEIVESLTNLDGFKGIKALVSNMVNQQVKDSNDK